MAKYEFLIDGDPIESSVEKQGEGFRVTVGEKTFDILPSGPGLYTTMIGGVRKTIGAVANKDTVYVDIDSVLFELKEPSEDAFGGGAGDAGGAKDKVFAPMPGKIVKYMVAVGDAVEKKQQVVIVEAMKMENPVLARAAGTVKAINFAVGDQVDTETPLLELDIPEEG